MTNYTKCPKCKYTWLPRTEKPVECPNCKKRLWRLKNNVVVKTEVENEA